MLKLQYGMVARWLAYLFYTVLVLVVLLWLLLPKDTLLQWVTGNLNSRNMGLEWQIDSLDIGPVAGLTFTGIKAVKRGGEPKAVINIDRVTVKPMLGRMIKEGKRAFSYQATLYNGSIVGTVNCVSGNECVTDGLVKEVELSETGAFLAMFDRNLDGLLSGSFSAKGDPSQPMQLEGVADLVVDQGHIILQQPVLGHTYFDFSMGTVSMRLRGDKVEISQGTLDSDVFLAQFEGEIDLDNQLPDSRVYISGELQPWSGLFTKVGPVQAVTLIRDQLQDGTLPFSISGTAGKPAVGFEEYAVLFESLQHRQGK